jgi:hypothetical protein
VTSDEQEIGAARKRLTRLGFGCYYHRVTLEEVQARIRPILERAGVQYAGVFGSVARGEAGPNSDIDILVKFKDPPTFSAYLNLDESLRSQLGRDVDLVTEGAVNKFLRPYIERDLKLVYGQR